MTTEARREKKREWDRAYNAANREKKREYQRAYRAANPEKARERMRAWRAANRERARGYSRAYRVANREKHLEQHRARKGLPIPTRPEPDTCEMCGGPPGKTSMNLDHCHATGVFRGWLCHSCNRGLGALGDTREALQRAAAYLVRAQSEMWLAIPGHGLPRSST
jgi:hypothetical protein